MYTYAGNVVVACGTASGDDAKGDTVGGDLLCWLSTLFYATYSIQIRKYLDLFGANARIFCGARQRFSYSWRRSRIFLQ